MLKNLKVFAWPFVEKPKGFSPAILRGGRQRFFPKLKKTPAPDAFKFEGIYFGGSWCWGGGGFEFLGNALLHFLGRLDRFKHDGAEFWRSGREVGA